MEKTTDFCKVTAVIRTGVLERVEQRLQELGVRDKRQGSRRVC